MVNYWGNKITENTKVSKYVVVVVWTTDQKQRYLVNYHIKQRKAVTSHTGEAGTRGRLEK